MDILFVTRWIPRDQGGGTQQRAAINLRAVAACGRAHLLYLDDGPCVLDLELGARVATVTTLSPAMAGRRAAFSFLGRSGLWGRLFRSAWGMSGLIARPSADEARAIRATLPLPRFDAICAFHLGSACVADALGVLRFGGRQTIDWDFLESSNVLPWMQAQRASTSVWRTAVGHFNRLKVQRLEARILKSWDAHFCSSTMDVDIIKQRSRSRHVYSINNAVAVPDPRPAPSGSLRPTAIFVGTMAYWPNLDAILHFIDRIWPSVRRALPAAELLIVGRAAPSELACWQGQQGIEVFSNVPRLQPFYERAHVAIAPLRFAVGSNLKIPEAMAHARPVVGYRRACERHALDQSQGVFSVDGEQSFAAVLIRLLEAPELSARYGEAAYRSAHESYSRPDIEKAMANLLLTRLLPN